MQVMVKTLKNTVILILIALICSDVSYGIWSNSHEFLDISLEAEKSNLLIGEPIKLIVKFTNNSDSLTLCLPKLRERSSFDGYIQLEITSPRGSKKYHRKKSNIFINREYNGKYYFEEFLEPKSSRQFIAYPNVGKISYNPRRFSKLFDKAGKYKVRVCYYAPERNVLLVRGFRNKVYSNQIILKFRSPNKIEREILSSLWEGNHIPLAEPDHDSYTKHEPDKILYMINKYPDHNLRRYLDLYLGKIYIGDGSFLERSPEEANIAIEILNELINKYPNFRLYESHCLLADAYYIAGRQEDSKNILEELINEHPILWNQSFFMWRYFTWGKNDPYAYLKWINDSTPGLKPSAERSMKIVREYEDSIISK
ncbi:MAG: tol-pal system YbgF family protein [Candidatus Hodarchaeota archaeon]